MTTGPDYPHEPRWHWRNWRSGALMIGLEWPWHVRFERQDDVYGGRMGLQVGPLTIFLHYDIGSCSSERRLEAWLSLSEIEAYERALRFEGRS